MKKSIFATAGVILGIGAATAMGVLIPAANAAISSGIISANTSNFIKQQDFLPVTAKEALLGTKKINNGNYVFYIGSQGISKNSEFLYDVSLSTNTENFIRDQADKPLKDQINVNGNYWKAVDYVRNDSKFKQTHTVPYFVSYIQTTHAAEITKEQIYKQCQSILDDAWNNRFEWKSLDKDARTKWADKLNYVRTRIEGSQIDKENIPVNLEGFLTANSPGGVDGRDKNVKHNPWIIAPNSIIIDYSPFATYDDIDGKNVYYANDALSNEFRNFVSYIKTRPEFSGVKDITSIPGIVVGYKDGKLTELFLDSFTPPATDENTTPDDQQTTASASKSRSIEPTKKTTTDTTANQNSADVSLKPKNNTFFDWIDKVFANPEEDSTN